MNKKITTVLYILIIFLAITITAGYQVIKNMSLYNKNIEFAGFIRKTLAIDNIERTYYLHLPDNIIPASPVPVVIVLHGGNGADAKTMSQRTRFNEIADREYFIVAYPQGIDGQWNDGRNKTFRKADNANINDTLFISSVIKDIVNNYQGNANQIFITGVSNGGMMTYRLAIEIGYELTAIAPVIANIPINLIDQTPVKPLPVLIINGTDDPLVSWEGGNIRILGSDYGEVVSTEETVNYWIKHNGLAKIPSSTNIIDTDQNDGCKVEVITYQGNETPAPKVVLYKIDGGGHNIPGSLTPDRPMLLGKKCMDINAPEEIWSFFKGFIVQ